MVTTATRIEHVDVLDLERRPGDPDQANRGQTDRVGPRGRPRREDPVRSIVQERRHDQTR